MTAMDAALAQALKNTRTAVALLMLLAHAMYVREQNRILARSDSGLPLTRLPGIVTAAADLQSLGQFGHRELGAHLLDQGIPLGCGPSERMPRAFFKISRWRRRCSFSWRNSRSSFSRSAALLSKLAAIGGCRVHFYWCFGSVISSCEMRLVMQLDRCSPTGGHVERQLEEVYRTVD